MKPMKILIVEDDVLSRGAMEKILESHNYETSSCATAEEAVIKLQEESFGILITDLHMPGMDGFELIRNTRTIHPDLRTIMITGFPSDEIKSKAKEERVDGFFSKPIHWDELYELLGILSIPGKLQNRNTSENIRKDRRPSLRREIMLGLLVFLLTIMNIQPLLAQPSFPKQNKAILKMDEEGVCGQSPVLTEEQAKALEAIQHAYMAEAMPLRRDLIVLRLELRYLVRDPNVQSKLLFDRQKKISELQAKLDDLSLSYQIKARSILTKEQLEQLPPDFSMGMGTGFGMDIGIGRGPRKGIR